MKRETRLLICTYLGYAIFFLLGMGVCDLVISAHYIFAIIYTILGVGVAITLPK